MRKLIFIFITAIIAITGCNSSSSSNSNSNPKTESTSVTSGNDNNNTSSTAADNNNSKNADDNSKKATRQASKTDYEVTVGSSFSIEMASNPTTGYHWHWINRNSVSKVDSIGYRYIQDSPGKMGSGGKEVWTFTGKRSGTDTICFNYSRAWVKNTAANSKAFTVKVD
jgi:predicted secreted protein